jgi:putative cofactor-binding repeat protein
MTKPLLPLRQTLPHCLAIALALGSHADATEHLSVAWPTRAALVQPALPAGSIAVTNCDDSGPGSFRQAVADAVNGDTIDLTTTGCSVITLASGDVAVTVDDLTLQGPGAQFLTISGNDLYRPVHHTGIGTVTVNDLTLSHGHAYLPVGQSGDAGGGCITSSGSVVVQRGLVDQCYASNSAASIIVRGGGIYAHADATVIDSVVSGNTVKGHTYAYGGGIYAAGNLVIVGSHITGNHATANASYGGGASSGSYAQSATSATVQHSLFDDNRAGNGGGLYIKGTALVASSTIAGNFADAAGGGISISSTSSTNPLLVRVQNSTISGNEANICGGACLFGSAQVSNSTIANNTGHFVFYGAGLFVVGGAFDLQSALIAGNVVGSAPDDIEGGATSLLGANNLILAATSLTVPADTIMNQDPLLLPLSDNGGPTPTHALDASSPAIDAGNNAGGLASDQRGSGFPRTLGTATDIGAFESGSSDPIFADGFDGH